jgi:hypothetical protein
MVFRSTGSIEYSVSASNAGKNPRAGIRIANARIVRAEAASNAG